VAIETDGDIKRDPSGSGGGTISDYSVTISKLGVTSLNPALTTAETDGKVFIGDNGYLTLKCDTGSNDEAMFYTLLYIEPPTAGETVTIYAKLKASGFGGANEDKYMTPLRLTDNQTGNSGSHFIKVGTDIPNTHWLLVTKDGSTSNTENMDSVSLAESWETIKIEWTTSDVKVYFDDTLEATSSSNLPTNGLWFKGYIKAHDGDTSTENGRFEYQYIHVTRS